jgi:hemolysin activation/secretion protein
VSRDGASSRFSVLNLGFTRYQTLSEAWSVKLAGAGQAASGPLFTSRVLFSLSNSFRLCPEKAQARCL